MELKIKDIVKNNLTQFSFLRGGNAYYTVTVDHVKYIYPVNLPDLGDFWRNEGDHLDALHSESARRRNFRPLQGKPSLNLRRGRCLLPSFDRSIMYSAATVEKKTSARSH
jgi:hypothetical protein